MRSTMAFDVAGYPKKALCIRLTLFTPSPSFSPFPYSSPRVSTFNVGIVLMCKKI